MKGKILASKKVLMFILCVNISILLIPFLGNETASMNKIMQDDNILLEDGWNAPEEQFMRGYTGKKPEQYYVQFNEEIFPSASYDSPTTIPDVIHVLVIMVQFADLSGTLTKSAVESRVFGSSNSLNDYYNEFTYGKTTIQGNATGWLTLPNNRAF